MNTQSSKKSNRTASGHKALAMMIGLFAALSSSSALSVDISQRPLYLGSDVPGNLVFVPSVEWPTINTQANLGNYDLKRRYAGYFDPDKCYAYQYSKYEPDRHFYPVGKAASFNCPGWGEWSGNYMNWAATQTIDPFRSALTGGYRVKDEVGETWLEKASQTSGSQFPDRRLPAGGNDAALVNNLTAASWGDIKLRIQGLHQKMRFAVDGVGLYPADSAGVVDYDPAIHGLTNSDEDRKLIYEVSVRVKVCDPEVGVEPNCQRYDKGWKPEGLIQEYSDRIRYSIFGYLNEHGSQRDGGALRARQKFVGPETHYPDEGRLANVYREWDPATGVLLRNPNPADAADTGHGVQDSGVIKYLNKFGQMTSKAPKSKDPVSEMYYAALRYFRGQGNLSAFTDNINYEFADGFPVITKWDDPIKYACQVNAALGIGDVYTWDDHDIPEPDLTLARKYTQKIFDLEGIQKDSSKEFSGRGNSAYIAGLAYFAKTNDLRPDGAEANSKGQQTLSTYWVDVREAQKLEPKENNQYWLATKYGGLRAPQGFDPLAAKEIDESWWHVSNEYLVSGTGEVTTTKTDYPRPDNFYVASEADKMVASLRQAFEAIVAEMKGSGGSFASNTTRLETGAMTFQAQFYSGNWGGELQGYKIDPVTRQMALAWTASSQFPEWAKRNIYFGSGTSLKAFEHGNLGGTALGSSSKAVIDYLRGDRSNEGAGGLRIRRGVLGDIVNSQPVYVGAPNPRLHRGKTFNGASTYPAFVAGKASRTPVVYVGANDGMLHAFNANTGQELFAFVPRASMGVLPGFTKPEYEHAYSVDGDITVADAYISGGWKTVLIGTLGRGGRSVFALDVTDPGSPKLLWEVDHTKVPELGNNLAQPIIGQVSNGQWRVFLGNGPNGSGGNAQLLMLDVGNGSATTVNLGGGPGNGLNGVNAWSSKGDGFVDTVYAGDLAGNLWKITGVSSSPKGTVFFKAGAGQPIMAAPLVARNPANLETWVFFGTGKYLHESDIATKGVQGWYGVIDKGSLPISKASLRKTSIQAEGEVSGRPVRAIDKYATSGTNGWYMDLVSPVHGEEGERMVVPNFFQGSALIGTTRIPDSKDVCNPSGKGWVMAISPFTGGRLSQTFFDVNKDGSFDAKDGLDGVPASGIGFDSSPNNPTFIGDIMLVSLDNAGNELLNTHMSESNVRRVSWREHTRID